MVVWTAVLLEMKENSSNYWWASRCHLVNHNVSAHSEDKVHPFKIKPWNDSSSSNDNLTSILHTSRLTLAVCHCSRTHCKYFITLLHPCTSCWWRAAKTRAVCFMENFSSLLKCFIECTWKRTRVEIIFWKYRNNNRNWTIKKVQCT